MAENLKTLIADVPDFPSPGILFRDISPLLASPHFDTAVAELAKHFDPHSFDLVAGVESRGFIFGAALAQKMGKGFVPIRKKGKLPPPVIGRSYQLEYGTDRLEVKRGSGRLVLVDDVLATGGTLCASADLCAEAGYDVAHIAVFIDLKFLNKFEWRGLRAKSVLQYDN